MPRIINQKEVFLMNFFEKIEFIDKCKKCHEKALLIKTNYIYFPKILIIILIYNNDFDKKIIYPKKDMNIDIESLNIKNNQDENEKEYLSYKLKSLIVKDANNNFETYNFPNNDDYKICEDNKLKYPIIFFYQRPKNDKIDRNNIEEKSNDNKKIERFIQNDDNR